MNESVHVYRSEFCCAFDLLVLLVNWMSLMICLVAEKSKVLKYLSEIWSSIFFFFSFGSHDMESTRLWLRISFSFIFHLYFEIPEKCISVCQFNIQNGLDFFRVDAVCGAFLLVFNVS